MLLLLLPPPPPLGVLLLLLLPLPRPLSPQINPPLEINQSSNDMRACACRRAL